MKPRHTWPLVLAATLICAGCTNSANAPSATNPTSPPALESRPAEPKLPTGAAPVNLIRPISAQTSATHTGR